MVGDGYDWSLYFENIEGIKNCAAEIESSFWIIDNVFGTCYDLVDHSSSLTKGFEIWFSLFVVKGAGEI